MANKKASIKSIRQSAVHAERNSRIRSRLKTFAKKVAAAKGDVDSVRQAAIRYVSVLDKAVKAGVIHANRSVHCKSLMAKYIF
ncbi:MAG: 30S ribosomal protein S20 [Puniceicoccales bacterium]|jgi:small subunit ribosomal protein S20|nr:30S ribosomal protein S20 [Puniceicoccales bacterium]